MSPSYAVSQPELHNQTDVAKHTLPLYPSRASLCICTTSHTHCCTHLLHVNEWWLLLCNLRITLELHLPCEVDMKSKLAPFTFLIDIFGLIFDDPLARVIHKEDNLFVIFNQNVKHFSASEILFPMLIFFLLNIFSRLDMWHYRSTAGDK